MVGDCLKLARNCLDQRAQIPGEVMTKGRNGFAELSLFRRTLSVGRRFAAMVTSYFALGVLTGMTGTVVLSYRRRVRD